MLKLTLLPNEKLHTASQAIVDITPDIVQYSQDMISACHHYEGIGLAAVQTGILQSMFVTCTEADGDRVFINPEILEYSSELSTHHEGCLSIPGVSADVVRPAYVRIRAINEEGSEFTLDAEGLLARVIQHEYDHLHGKLFYEYLRPGQQRRLLHAYNEGKSDYAVEYEK